MRRHALPCIAACSKCFKIPRLASPCRAKPHTALPHRALHRRAALRHAVSSMFQKLEPCLAPPSLATHRLAQPYPAVHCSDVPCTAPLITNVLQTRNPCLALPRRALPRRALPDQAVPGHAWHCPAATSHHAAKPEANKPPDSACTSNILQDDQPDKYCTRQDPPPET